MGRTFGIRQFVDGLQRITPTGGALDRVDRARTAASPNSMMWDIADPYRRGSRAARACALELDGLVLDLGRLLGCKPVS
ncbi:hypothetical protein, partial [Escherichia coli]|uniref:hypothetical protein n=1 Tax=Escherichia coli TaxID=562 RepID=UPI0019668D40